MVSADPFRNAFLKSLRPADFAAIRPHLKAVELLEGASVIELGQTVAWAHFPLTAVVNRYRYIKPEAGTEVFCRLYKICIVATIGKNVASGFVAVINQSVAIGQSQAIKFEFSEKYAVADVGQDGYIYFRLSQLHDAGVDNAR